MEEKSLSPFGSLQSYAPSSGKLFGGDCPLSLAGGRHAGHQGKTVAINVNGSRGPCAGDTLNGSRRARA